MDKETFTEMLKGLMLRFNFISGKNSVGHF